MQTDVKAKYLTGTALSNVGPCRIKGASVVAAGSAGTVVIRRGSATGETLLTIGTPASAAAAFSVVIPGEGILFSEDPHLTLTNVVSITFFYG
jgi:hypothetical protein